MLITLIQSGGDAHQQLRHRLPTESKNIALGGAPTIKNGPKRIALLQVECG